MLRQELENIAYAYDRKKHFSIDQSVVDYAKEHLEEVIAYALGPQKMLCRPAIEIIRTIGYPGNERAIPALVANIGDPNSPGWNVAGETLRKIDPIVVSTYLIEYLYDCCLHKVWDDIDSIYTWLASHKVERSYAVHVGPFIAYALCKNFYDGFPLHDPLTVLEKIGSECATYALPILLELADKYREDPKKLGEQIWSLIHSCGQEQLAPYAYIINELEKKKSFQ